MKSSIIESIKSLPPLSKTILQINQVSQDSGSGIAELVRVIEQDPMIVANLLKTANSPLYGFGKEIKSVTQAVTLFGMKQTKSIALGHAVKKLLNVDMRPYGITSDKFAEISALQAALITKWYNHIDKEIAQTLHLAAFLQETGKILIASDVIQEDEDISFASEIALSNNIAQVELSYVGVTTSEVTAAVFEHWGFGEGFIEMIRFADKPNMAPEDLKELSMALHIVKTALPVNKPFSEMAINFALRKARDAGYDHEILEDVIDEMLDTMEKA